MKQLDPLLSLQFRRMSILCACLVVLIHSTVAPALGSWQWWIAFLVGKEGVCRIAVPFFFLAAGFFLAGRVDESEWYKRAIKSRVWSLLVPFLIWMVGWELCRTLIALGMRVIRYSNYHGSIAIPDCSLAWGLKIIGLNPFENIGPLWFVRTLFLFVLLSPLIVGALRRRAAVSLGALVAVLLCFESLRTPYCAWDNCFEYFCSLRGLFYFSCGIWCRLNSRPRSRTVWCNLGLWIGIGLLVVKGILLSSGCVVQARVLDVVMTPMLLLGVWAIIGWFSRGREQVWLEGYSFPIFLLHMHFMLFASICFAAMGFSDAGKSDLIFMGFRFFIAFGGAVGATWILRRAFPRFAKIAFGGR